MALEVPTVLQSLSSAGSAFRALTAWRKKSRGDARALIGELKGTDLSSWSGKSTEDLFESIFEKLNLLKIKFPHVAENSKYRWSVRVDNIRKRIWLLLQHVSA